MIYVASIGNSVTGGPETLHQIAGVLKNNGNEVRMVYIDPNTAAVPEKYKNYGVQAVSSIVDSSDNILMVPETRTYILRKYKNIRKCIIWLSVDNYLNSMPNAYVLMILRLKHRSPVWFPLEYIRLYFKGKIHYHQYSFDKNQQVFHTYNCEYARRFLYKHGISAENCAYLCGPLNEIFFDKYSKKQDFHERENLILYNPNKGTDFTKKLIEYCMKKEIDAGFIPITGMTTEKIADTMQRAKIYIDFGEFPGPERIPREAALMGCCLLTSRSGAAENDIDVPIPEKFKFDADEQNFPIIYDNLCRFLADYEKYVPLFDLYREKIIAQREEFSENVLDVACKKL